jgi:hypothetical protein
VETKNRQKLLMIVVGLVVLLFVGDSLVFEPLVAGWKARQQRIADLHQQVDQGKTMLQREYGLHSRWESMRTNALPANQSLGEAQLFKAFDRWERASGVSRASMKPQWKQGDDDTYSTLECRADYNGDINTIKRFLYEVEKDPMGVKVENVEISSHDDNGQQLALSLTLSGLQLTPTSGTQQP